MYLEERPFLAFIHIKLELKEYSGTLCNLLNRLHTIQVRV